MFNPKKNSSMIKVQGMTFYEKEEAKEILHIKDRVLYRLLREGKLTPVRIGRKVHISERNIADYLRNLDKERKGKHEKSNL